MPELKECGCTKGAGTTNNFQYQPKGAKKPIKFCCNTAQVRYVKKALNVNPEKQRQKDQRKKRKKKKRSQR